MGVIPRSMASFALPRRERRILEYLASNGGRRATKTQVFNAVYGLFDQDVEEYVVESHISKCVRNSAKNSAMNPSIPSVSSAIASRRKPTTRPRSAATKQNRLGQLRARHGGYSELNPNGGDYLMSLYGMMRTGVSGMKAQANRLSTVADNIANSTDWLQALPRRFSTLMIDSVAAATIPAVS